MSKSTENKALEAAVLKVNIKGEGGRGGELCSIKYMNKLMK